MQTPRQLSLFRFNFDSLPVEYHSKFPFTPDARYVFFGEISNMPEHCVVAGVKTGQLYTGYHTESFVELTDEGYRCFSFSMTWWDAKKRRSSEC